MSKIKAAQENAPAPTCKNCQVEMQPLHTGWECTKCGLILHQDGGIIYDPKSPRWLSGPAI
jgi:ribosomal protein L37AE/L43A